MMALFLGLTAVVFAVGFCMWFSSTAWDSLQALAGACMAFCGLACFGVCLGLALA